MKIEIPLTEVQEFLSNFYNIKVDLKNIKEDKIEANYLVSLVLTIKKVKKDEVVFHYELNGLVDLLAKGAHFLLEKKLDNSPIEWNSSKDEVTINLEKVKALSDFLKVFYISELKFVDNDIVLILNTQASTE